MVKKYNFWEIFSKNHDGTLTPKRIINVNGITFGQGISFSSGVAFGGIDFFQYQNKDIAAEDLNGVLIIKGFYN
jgi:hypothetical protein